MCHTSGWEFLTSHPIIGIARLTLLWTTRFALSSFFELVFLGALLVNVSSNRLIHWPRPSSQELYWWSSHFSISFLSCRLHWIRRNPSERSVLRLELISSKKIYKPLLVVGWVLCWVVCWVVFNLSPAIVWKFIFSSKLERPSSQFMWLTNEIRRQNLMNECEWL